MTVDQIGLIEEASLGHGDKANFSIIRLDAHHLARGVGIRAHFIEVVAIEEAGDEPVLRAGRAGRPRRPV